MSLRTKEYFIKESCISIHRNSLMSIASISTVALSLLVLGLFVLLVVNTNNIASTLESQVQVTVYMNDSANKAALEETAKNLAALNGVQKVTFTNKAQALELFKERLSEKKSLLDSLGDNNPMPNYFEVFVDQPERIKQLVPILNDMPEVESIKYGQETVEQLFKITRIVRIGGIILIIFLALSTVFIISNTIRLTVFARKREVLIMKYVGATDWFIRWPFLLEGMFLGLIGSLISLILLSWIYAEIVRQVHANLAFFPLIAKQPLFTYVSIIMLILGVAIGAAGSYISLRKFLKV